MSAVFEELARRRVEAEVPPPHLIALIRERRRRAFVPDHPSVRAARATGNPAKAWLALAAVIAAPVLLSAFDSTRIAARRALPEGGLPAAGHAVIGPERPAGFLVGKARGAFFTRGLMIGQH